jgi:hypothetical protein
VRRVGFEPAKNLACEAAAGTDRIVPDFFSTRPVAGEQSRVVTSIAIFYDLEDPSAFVAAIASILMEEGVWVIEMHYLPVVLECSAFDAICHEQLEYDSLSSLEPLLARHGLLVADVETNDRMAEASACTWCITIRPPLPFQRDANEWTPCGRGNKPRDCSSRAYIRILARACGRLARNCKNG